MHCLVLGLGLSCTAWAVGCGPGSEGGVHLAWMHTRFVSAGGTAWGNKPNTLCTAAVELVCPPFGACRRFGPTHSCCVPPPEPMLPSACLTNAPSATVPSCSFGPIYDYELQPATHEKGRTDQWGCVRLGPGGVPGVDATVVAHCGLCSAAQLSGCMSCGSFSVPRLWWCCRCCCLPAVAADQQLSPPPFLAAAL